MAAKKDFTSIEDLIKEFNERNPEAPMNYMELVPTIGSLVKEKWIKPEAGNETKYTMSSSGKQGMYILQALEGMFVTGELG